MFYLQCSQVDRSRSDSEKAYLSYSINDATAYAAVAKLKLLFSCLLSLCHQNPKLDLACLFTQYEY